MNNWLFEALISNQCLAEARKAGERERSQYEQKGRLQSGADVADAPRWGMIARAWRRLSNRLLTEHVFNNLYEEWEEYCKEMNAKIEAAPKMKRGPMAGCSTIHYKHCSPESITSDIIHIRNMYRRIRSMYELPGESQ